MGREDFEGEASHTAEGDNSVSETNILRRVQLIASEHGARLFRNQTGFCQCRKQPIRYGIPATGGGPDLIGWAPGGRFLGVEIKTETGRVRENQVTFLNAIRDGGGLGFIARSEDEFVSLLKKGVT